MLVIRAEQMRAFERSAELLFRQRLEAHLAAFLEQRGVVYSEEALGEEVNAGLAACLEFGLERQSDIARCLEIICGFAGGFGAGPLPKEAQNILFAYRADPALKLDRLQAWAANRLAGKQ